MTDIIRVLLIEDDEDDYFLTADYLSQCEDPRFQLSWVTNGEDALAALKKKPFDICLLDYILGPENALDVLENLKAHGISVPVVILTGQSDTQVDEMVMRAGAADYLTKLEIETPRFMRTIRYAMVRSEIENERVERHKVEQQNKAKDKFLAHLGHELRTPLTSILGYTELLLDDDKSEKIQQELSIIHTNGKHLLSLLNDLLDMSRIMANKLELSPRTIHFSPFMTDVHSLMNLAAKDKGLSLTIQSDTLVPEQIFTDPTRLRQVLINLISNAVKFTDSGKIVVTVSLQSGKGLMAPPKLQFDVEDTGIGMPPDKLDSIFQPFEQIEDVMRANHGGAGLGLAISRELVHKMGGELTVTSRFGEGSKFTFSIHPGAINEGKLEHLSLTSPQATVANDPHLHVTGRVLIVDDLREIRRLTGHLVSQCHAKVGYAENGVKALEAVLLAEEENHPYHLVLMDIHMPVMNGIDALNAIRRHKSQVAVVAITAASRKGLKQSLLEQGFDDVIGKPIDKTELLTVLDKYLIRTNEPTNAGRERDSVVHRHLPKDNASQRKKILVVEDDFDASELMQLLLTHQGHDVMIAHNGKEAVQCLKESSFDYVLLDLTLPDTDGYALAEDIKTYQGDIRIVIVSGYEPDHDKMSELGIEEALVKPVSKEMLANLIN
ncbi:response regulator [Alteromonas ponticola]|uniref:histidine kinase n=1 Tax=Alteromonas aquimaris TaxID=2998417 RepID=A0ABT3P667_9ALTE|nr:response regulator [Alteromonas aquimaris]MCW8108252.1 response regulator [Alteromonas aquimaris]